MRVSQKEQIRNKWGSHLIIICDSSVFLRTTDCLKAELYYSLYSSFLTWCKSSNFSMPGACASHGPLPLSLERGLPAGLGGSDLAGVT